MKKVIIHILRAVLFVSILFVMLYFLSKVMTPKTNNKEDGMFDENANAVLSEAENSIDVLIIGDSEVYSGFIPPQIWEEHGITSYCCSTAGQNMAYSLDFLESAIEKQSPQVLIMETNQFYRKLSFDDSIMNKVEKLLPIFKYHDHWKTLSLSDFTLDTEIEYSYSDNNKGYKFVKKVIPADPTNYMEQTLKSETLSQRNMSYTNSIKKLCDDSGIELILVSTPSTKNWNNKRHDGMVELSKQLGVKYIDLNMMTDEVPIDWEKDTYDEGDHMNYYGAKKVTEYLGNYLEKLGIFEDHRGDEKYKSWDDSLKAFKKMINKHLKN